MKTRTIALLIAAMFAAGFTASADATPEEFQACIKRLAANGMSSEDCSKYLSKEQQLQVQRIVQCVERLNKATGRPVALSECIQESK